MCNTSHSAPGSEIRCVIGQASISPQFQLTYFKQCWTFVQKMVQICPLITTWWSAACLLKNQ